MGVDPSIILGIKPPQFDNQVDVARSAAALQQAGYQNQMMQRQMKDDQAVRSAYQAAMTAGPDGTPTFDRKKFTQTLTPENPMLANQKTQEFAQQDAAKAKSDLEVDKARHEKAREIAWSIPTEQNIPAETKKAAYASARQAAIAAGLPGAEQSPQEWPGDNFVKQMQMHTLDAQKQAEMVEKQSEFASREADRKLARDQMGVGKQNTAFQQTQSILESARGNPEVSQALKDRYAAKKFEGLVNLYGDPNKLNPAQVQMAATEVAKIASGGVPTHSELQGLQPSSIPSGLASLAEKVMNNPQSAEAGEFLKRMGDYVGALKKDAQGVIKEKYGRVIETRRGQLGEQHYKDLKAQYLDPLNEQPKAASGDVPVLKTHEIEW